MTPGTHDRESLPVSLLNAADAVGAAFGASVLDRVEFRGELTLTVAPEIWIDVLAFCRDEEVAAFDQLDCLLGDHLPQYQGAPFAVIVHLTSHKHGHRLRVKTALAEGQALRTATGLWPSADFDERETWEMYGVVFTGHPNLKRLLTTDDFEGFPLRKDFPLAGTFGGRVRTDLRGKI